MFVNECEGIGGKQNEYCYKADDMNEGSRSEREGINMESIDGDCVASKMSAGLFVRASWAACVTCLNNLNC